MGRGITATRLGAEAMAIVLCATVVGVAHNAVSENGIPLRTPAVSRPETAIQWSLHLEGIHTTLDQAKEDFDRGALFVDVRSPSAYLAGHIPDARHLEVYGFVERWSDVLGDVPWDKRIVAYCSGGSCQSSTKMARLLVEQGFTNVGCFYTGWQAWVLAGHPVLADKAEGG